MFPSAIPSFTQPSPGQTLDVANHTALHIQEEDNIVYLATKLGTGSSTPTVGTILRGTGSGTSSWGKLTLSTDVNTFSSSDLRTLLTDETGSGVAVFGTGPTLSDITVNGNIDIQDSFTAIRDSSDNELVKFAKTTSAVNEITITNAATTGNPLIAPSGGDTNIHLRLQGKGTGGVWADLYNPYKFRVTKSSSQNTVAASFTKVQFNVEDFDTNNNFDSSTNYRYTAPVTGYYQFNWNCHTANGADVVASLFKNGTEITRGQEIGATSTPATSAGSALVSANANDYFEIHVYNNALVAFTVSQLYLNTFSGFLVSRS